LSQPGDKIKEALIEVRLKSHLLPSLWEGPGEGRSYGKEKSKYPGGIFFLGINS